MRRDRTGIAGRGVEWLTLGLVVLCYGGWAGATGWLAGAAPAAAVAALAVVLTLHSSLCHEILHGHPFRSRRLNAALAFPALGLFIPFERFRALHLAHHRDATLTDPYDDPESNFLDPAQWRRLPRALRWLFAANNTLAGRMALGPAISLAQFWADEARGLWHGAPGLRRAWALHIAGLAGPVLWLSGPGQMTAGSYLLGVYLALSLLKIRSFAEHRAHRDSAARSVIVEDRGPLALLFLNNNLHAVHHRHPRLPWYRLPAAYAARRGDWLADNGGYRYPSYAAIFARHLLRAKDPVAHPLRAS